VIAEGNGSLGSGGGDSDASFGAAFFALGMMD
jgi:hypothetical protein